MFKELFTSEKSKLRFEFISNILKNSKGKFLLGDKVSCFFSSVFHSKIDNTYGTKYLRMDEVKFVEDNL